MYHLGRSVQLERHTCLESMGPKGPVGSNPTSSDMIYPHEVPRTINFAKVEARIDAELKPDWVEGESRIIRAGNDDLYPNSSDPLVFEMRRRYAAAGWSCEVHGYNYIQFYCPKPPSPPSTRKWWQFWKE